jgi:glutathione S-transferase
MTQPVLHIFSYLPNPRVAKALIAADFCGVRVETRGDAPAELQGWLWDFDARPLDNAERVESSPHARTSRRGFSGTLFKTDAFLRAHPFGTVPAAFGPEGRVGIFESNSILRAVARAAESTDLYGRDGYEASRIDSFLDASLVFAREAQVYLLGIRDMTAELHARMQAAYQFYLDGIEAALTSADCIAGDSLSLADISFVCDLGQFLTERRGRKTLDAAGFLPVTNAEPTDHPRTFEHLFRLGALPEFERHIGSLLDHPRKQLGLE